MNKKVRILSIDGGGIRGIIPGTILQYFESQIQEKTGNASAKLSDYFDMIAGTSTGGILASLYLTPNEAGRPKYSAEEVLGLYLKKGGEIFHQSVWQKSKTLGGLLDEKYDAEALEEEMAEYFQETLLSDLLKPCLLTAYDIEHRKASFFRNVHKENKHVDFKVKDAARATSAAPTYFEPAMITSLTGEEFALVDGGMFANNPAMCAYSDARGMDFSQLLKDEAKPNNPRAKDMVIVSISTGSSKESYDYEKAKDWGMAAWIKPIIDILMSGNSDTIDYHLKQIFSTTEDPACYLRLEPKLEDHDPSMDNAKEENLADLHQLGLNFVEANREVIDGVIDKLILNH